MVSFIIKVPKRRHNTTMKIILVHTPFKWSKPLTIISHLIRKVSKTFYNHASFLIEEDGEQLILESDIHGVVSEKLVDWVRNQTVSVYEVPAKLRPKVRKMAVESVGKFGYSFADLFWFMPIYIITNKWYGRTVDEAKNKPTCYEYLAKCLGFDNWFRMTPNEFKNEMEKRGFKQVSYNIKSKDLIK
jgi:hypothetical protein